MLREFTYQNPPKSVRDSTTKNEKIQGFLKAKTTGVSPVVLLKKSFEKAAQMRS